MLRSAALLNEQNLLKISSILDCSRYVKASQTDEAIKYLTEKSLLQLIKSLINNKRDSNLVSEVRLIDQIVASAKKLSRDSKDAVAQNWDDIISVVVQLMWASVAVTKVNRKLIQLLSELEKVFPQIIALHQDEHHVRLDEDSDSSYLALWSGFICQTIAGQQLVTAQLDDVLGILSRQLGVQVGDSSWTVQRQHHLQSLVKLLLDLLQRCKEPIITHIRCDNRSTNAGCWPKIITKLFRILQLNGAPKDCCLLSGTALCQLLVLYNGTQSFATDVDKLYHTICEGGSLAFGDVVCDMPSNDNGLLTFGHLALLSGILAVSDAKLLIQRFSSKQLNERSSKSSIRENYSDYGIKDTGCVSMNSSNSIPGNYCGDFLLSWLHRNICQMSHLAGSQYQAFKQLSLFFSKAMKYLREIHAQTNQRLFGPRGDILKSTLDLIWTHLDSPVDGVNECVLDIFKSCLSLAEAELALIDDESGPEKPLSGASELDCLVGELLGVLLKMSWEVRGRHNLVAVLICFTDMMLILRTHPHIVSDISCCMATNYLAPAATNLYLAIVKHFSHSDTPGGLDMWRETCLSMLLDSMTSANQLVRLNASQHLLPLTLKMMPRSLSLIQDNLEQQLLDTQQSHQDTMDQIHNDTAKSEQGTRDRVHQTHESQQETRDRILHGYLALLKTARNCQILKEWPVVILKEALVHPDDDIRLDAFCLICISPKTSEPLSDSEVELLQGSLSDNMNIDEPPFRHQLQKCIRHTIARSRDSALVSLKLTAAGKGDETLHTGIGYIDWLWRLCMRHLHPGSNYQHLKTCLDWATVILDSLTVQLDRRKGGGPEQTPALLEYAQSKSQLCLYTSDSCLALLSCLLYDTDQIKQQSAELLKRYFPWPLPLSQTKHIETQLLHQALTLCNSPRARETGSGAALCHLMYNKYIVDGGHQFCVGVTDNELSVQYVSHIDGEEAALSFITDITQILEISVQRTKTNVLEAARVMPSHGFLLACCQCLSLCKGHLKEPHRWQNVAERLQIVATELIDIVLEVLGAKLDTGESAPSFEQMGVAIQKIIANQDADMPDLKSANQDATLEQEAVVDREDQLDGSVLSAEHQEDQLDRSVLSAEHQEDQLDGSVLSAEHQMVMSWCWLNIRDCSILLSSLVEYLPSGSDCSSPATTILYADVQQAADTLVKVLTKCRHRGAIEGCNQGFLRLCTTLLSSSVDDLYHIPHMLLDRILDQLQQFSQSSVTRRSAGLPLIVQSIVASEATTKQSHLLTKAVTSLLAVIQEPMPTSHNQQEDLPQVHALNIIKAVFREKSVSQTIMPHISTAFITAIDLISSPFWAVRNAAMQLFGTLQSRMLGQKKTADDRLHTTTAPEFFTLFPDLHPYMMAKVKDASFSLSMGELRLHPSLFPVLSVLAKLSPGLGTSDVQRSLDEFRGPIASLSASPLYAVRVLSANALLALIPQHTALQHVVQLTEQLPASRSECDGFNKLHGHLLQLQMLLHTHKDCRESEKLATILSTKLWLITDDNPCYMVRSAFIELAQSTCLDPRILDILNTRAAHMLSESTDIAGEDGIQVCRNEYILKLTHWWLTHSPESLTRKLTQCMTHGSHDVRLACLSWLSLNKQSLSQQHWDEILDKLVHCLHEQPAWEEQCAILRLILDVTMTFDLCPGKNWQGFMWKYLLDVVRHESDSLPAALCLAVSGLMVKSCLAEKTSFDDLLEWTETIQQCACPSNPEPLLENTALALSITGSSIIQHCMRQSDDPSCRGALHNVLKTCLQLLQDENASTRNMSAKLVAQLYAQLTLTKEDPLHYNTAIQRLMDILPRMLPGDLTTISWLYGCLGTAENLVNIIKNTQKHSIMEQFEASDINPYEESVVCNTYILGCIKNLKQEHNSDIDVWLQQQVAALYSEVVAVTNVISSVIDDHVLNVTYYKPVFEGVYRLQCKLVSLDHWCQGLDESKLLDATKQKLSIACSHPCLRPPVTFEVSSSTTQVIHNEDS